MLTACCIFMGWRHHEIKDYLRQRQASNVLIREGFSIKREPAGTPWLRPFFDPALYQDVVEVRYESQWKGDAKFVALADLPNLKRVYIANNSITDRTLNLLKPCKYLQRVSLWSTNISDRGMQVLAGKKYLEALDIHGTRISDRGIRHLAGATNLRFLKLPQGVTDEGLRHLSKLTKLKHLSFPTSNVSAQGLATFENAPLERLDCYLRDGEDDLKYISRLRHLKEISMFVPIDPKNFKYLREMPALESLTLSSTLIDDSFIDHIKELPYLRSVSLHGTRITDEGVRAFEEMPWLTNLLIQSSLITSGVFQTPVRLPKSLHLSSPGLTPELKRYMKYYGHVRDRGKLQIIHEFPNHQQQPWIEGDELRQLLGQIPITELTITKPYLYACGIEALQQLGSLHALHIYPSSNDRGIDNDSIAKMSQLDTLRILSLTSYDMDEQGVRALTKMKNLKKAFLNLPLLDRKRIETLKEQLADSISIEFLEEPFNTYSHRDQLVADVSQLTIYIYCNRESWAWAPIDDNDIELLSRRENPPKKLDLSYTKVSDLAVKHMGQFPNLIRLSLAGTNIRGTHFDCLKDMQNLSLGGVELDKDALFRLPRNKLQSLNLTNAEITHEHLRGLAGMSALRNFTCCGYQRPIDLSGDGLAVLSELPSLKELILDNTSITSADLKHLEGLQRIHTLSLNYTQVDDSAVDSLLKLKTLSRLRLDGTSIGYEGALRLSKLPKLTNLSLMWTGLSEAQLGIIFNRVNER